jgi:hypothetical protein
MNSKNTLSLIFKGQYYQGKTKLQSICQNQTRILFKREKEENIKLKSQKNTTRTTGK